MFSDKVSGSTESLFEARLKHYGAMSLAIAGAAFAPQGHASTIFYSGNGETAASSPVFFNFFTGAANHTGVPSNGSFGLMRTLSPSTHGSFARIGWLAAPHGSKGILDTAIGSVANLPRGAFVGPGETQTFVTHFGHFGSLAKKYDSVGTFGNFEPVPQTGYVGLEFGGPGGEYYGWANVTVNSDYSITLNGFAYNNTPNQGIVVEPVPEPSSLLLLTLGAAGIAAYRRKRATRAE
jgi:hypothetical protein